MSDFYKKTTPGINYYSTATFGSEPNMRNELSNTFDGLFPEIAKAQDGLLRHMRTDSNGKLIPCPCVDSLTGEPDKDRFCPVCYGEGFVWDEINIQYYKVLKDSDLTNATRKNLIVPGLINAPLVVFYIRYDAPVTEADKVILLELHLDGTKVSPVRRKSVYRINTVWDYRSDLGKLEYWKLYAHTEKVKFLNTPGYGDV